MGTSSSRTEELLNRARAGDSRAWAELDQRYRGPIGAGLRNALDARSSRSFDQDDVVQSALMEAYKQLDTFVYRGPGSLQRWITTIALNRLRDKLRSADVRRTQNPGSHGVHSDVLQVRPCEEPGPDECAERVEEHLRVLDALEQLPEFEREVVFARIFEHLSTAEIARRIESTDVAVRRAFARAMATLGRKLGNRRVLD